jgi:hypothetical protein
LRYFSDVGVPQPSRCLVCSAGNVGGVPTTKTRSICEPRLTTYNSSSHFRPNIAGEANATSQSQHQQRRKNLYRFYSYTSPIYFRKKIREADNVEKLFELMQLEFDFMMMKKI